MVASAISTQALSYTMKVGMNAPLYAVSAGKIALSDLRPQELSEYLNRVTFVPVTPHTVRSKPRLKKELQQVKATGFAYSHEEFTLGITAIATAVRSGAKLTAPSIWPCRRRASRQAVTPSFVKLCGERRRSLRRKYAQNSEHLAVACNDQTVGIRILARAGRANDGT